MRLIHILSILLLLTISTSLTGQGTAQQINTAEQELATLKQKEKALKNKLETLRLTKVKEDLKAVAYPKCTSGCEVVEHEALVLCYDEQHEQARWVAHIIIPEVISGNLNRTNDFREDDKVKTGSATLDDYWFSGYDRGHVAPSADFRWSGKGISESYLYSNMSPQLAELNRERWAELEGFLRNYVITRKRQLHVVAGGILTEGLSVIGESKVSVPKLYYKVALDEEGKQSIGFILPNKECTYPLQSYAVSVDSVEALTGIDFFPNVPDSQEADFDYTKWTSEGKNVIADVSPMRPPLPKGLFNTVQARLYEGDVISVCGTVVATKFSQKSGATFLNMDKKFPNQIFSVSIWKDNRSNFSYPPEEYLLGKKICVTGKVSMYQGKPTMNIKDQSKVTVMDDEEF